MAAMSSVTSDSRNKYRINSILVWFVIIPSVKRKIIITQKNHNHNSPTKAQMIR